MNEIRIRAATTADVPAIMDIVGHAYRHYVAQIGRPPGPMLDDSTVSLTCSEQKRARRGMRDHAVATASRHWFATSARKIRSVERETRWRWRLKVL